MIHAICQVEDQRAATLCLRIVAEMGKVSLMGLRAGTSGHIEIGDLVFPCEVTHAILPKIQVVIFPQHAQPARRQLLRVPASFLVRVRRQGSDGLWISGQGIDISAGGCSFLLTPPYIPKPGSPYDIDMLLTLPRNEEERPFLAAEVRWVKTTNQHIYVGIETSHPAQRRTLTNATAKVQLALSRHPEDYLLT